MLGIGFKISDTPLDGLKRPLEEYIKREYSTSESGSRSDELSEEHREALDRFFSLKADVDAVRTASTLSRHVLLQYYAQLERMAARFPLQENLNSSRPGLKLQFTWNDSFSPRKKITQSNIKYEQAAIMFNFGALESQLGVHTDRNSAEGLKNACRHFTLAAGAFEYVHEKLVHDLPGAATPDLSQEGLGMLRHLMLAQAQACFYEKAIKDQMKHSIKAKLVAQAHDMYKQALRYCTSSKLVRLIDRSWAMHLSFQVECMAAATQYWAAKAANDRAKTSGEGYGEEIARLTAAGARCKEAVKIASEAKLPNSLLQSAKSLQDVSKESLDAAQKDNASVYMEQVPNFGDLAEVDKACMVSPTQLSASELQEELKEDLFEPFVPRAVLEKAANVKKEIEEMLQKAKAKVDERQDLSKKTLQELGLPASIEAFEDTSDNGIPANVWRRIEQLQSFHHFSDGENAVRMWIDSRLQENQGVSDAVENKLRLIEDTLAEEETEDNVCRQNYGNERWLRPVSSALNQGFRADVDRYYRLLREAKQSDEVVRQKYRDNEHLLRLLSQSKQELDDQLPNRKEEGSTCNMEITELSDLLAKVNALSEEENQLIQEFDAAVDMLNVLPVLLNHDDDDAADSAVQKEKHFFQEQYVDKADTLCSEEESLVNDISSVNERFDARKEQDPVLVSRQAFLQQTGDAVDVFQQLESHLQEGGRFYQELFNRIEQLRQTVEDHCSARELEKREIELNLKADQDRRNREEEDARMAQHMMQNLQFQEGRPRDNTQIRNDEEFARQLQDESRPRDSTQVRQDEELARQLAGEAAQRYPSMGCQNHTPDYVHVQSQSKPSHTYGNTQWQHPYSSYEQQYGSNAPPPPNPRVRQSPSNAPPPGQVMGLFGNYYDPQAPPSPPNPTQHQTYGYQQYPGAQPSGYDSRANRHSPPGSSV